MKKILNSFKDKKFLYGTYSVFTVFIVIAILIVFNLVVNKFDYKIDLTPDNMHSISETSKDIISEINEDVKIYALFKTSTEKNDIISILEQYPEYSKNIELIYKDPYLYPQFVDKYITNDEQITNNSIIVESGERFKVIQASELLNYDFDYNTGQYIPQSLNIEPKITSAIQYVTMEEVPTIYYVTGHNEMPIQENFKSSIETANYDLKEINLVNMESVPEDCAVLVITTPSKDYSEQEADKIKQYLQNDGRAIVMLNYTSIDMPHLNSIIETYGAQINKSIIVEGSASHSIQNSPTWILPEIKPHDITVSTVKKGYSILIPQSQAVNIMDLKKSTLDIQPLLTTSEKAYGKNNPESQSINREETDEAGPFNVAVAITDSYFTDIDHTTKLVVIASSDFIVDSVNSSVSGTNVSFVLDSLNWLVDKQYSTYIAPKSLIADNIIIDSARAGIIIIISCVVIPLALFLTGFFVWLRRRNK